MKFKRLISFLIVLILAISVPFTAAAETVTTVIACSDFQHPNGNESGKSTVKELLSSLKSYGITSADGFLCCGDYNYGNANTAAGINALKGALSDVVSQNMVFVQGNHDEAVSTNVGLAKSGNNDTENYGVFVINEDDYMWGNTNENTVKKTAQYLINYLNDKLESGYTQPIFVLSHLPLHYNMRTRLDGDAKYANYIFDALNAAGKKGLNIIFMYGHDHSNGWDDYLGGAAVYLKKGDSILIAQSSQTSFLSKTLEFTYMNAGFVGYYDNHNGADDTLTMTSFEISKNAVEVARYNTVGYHKLKSQGVRNAYKNESGYSPNTTVYDSPQTITLTAVTDRTPIENIMDIPDPNKQEGDRLVKIASVGELKDGGKYMLVYNASPSYIMAPNVVIKSNGSTYRQGFDLVECDGFGENMHVMSGAGDNLWTFTKSDSEWLIGDGEKYIKFTSTSDMAVTATLENAGERFTISGSDGAFNFTGGGYVLNYNARGLINGFANNPAPFYIYEFVGHTVFVEGGSTDKAHAKAGDSVTITANLAPEGKEFDKWVYMTGSGYINDLSSEQITFTMPDSAVKVKATYKDIVHICQFNSLASDSLFAKATCKTAALYYVKCDGCDEISGDKTVAVGEPSKDAHNYSEYVPNNNATTESDGTKTRTCTLCGDIDTVTDEGTKLPKPEPEVEIKDTSEIFTDIDAKAWYKEYVDYVVAYGIFTGTSKTEFSPTMNITRAQFVQVLANLEGVDTSNRNVTTVFTDVPAKKWFTAAVKWASDNKIVNGVGNNRFDPEANVTREQMCVMLVNFTQFKDIALKAVEPKESFADDKNISGWAKSAVYTCQTADIVNGKGKGIFDPQGTGTRAEASVIFTKFHKDYLTK